MIDDVLDDVRAARVELLEDPDPLRVPKRLGNEGKALVGQRLEFG